MEYFAHGGSDSGYDMMNNGFDGHMSGSPWGWLLMLVVLAAVAAGIVWLIKMISNRSASTKNDDPLDTVKSRYAKGEITKAQYEEIKKDLKSN